MIKIENKPVSAARRGGTEYQEFLDAVKKLEKDQSFVTKLGNRDRMALTIAGALLDRRYITRKEGTLFRVGRVL